MAARIGSAQWRGTLKGGDGTVKAGDTIEGAYSFETRFGDGGPGTNPEELIGAALAGCFSMALSNSLDQEGHTPESVDTTASVYIRNVDGKPTIQRIELETVGNIPGLDEQKFVEFAEQTKDGCIISRALGGVEEIVVNARLTSGVA